MVVFYSTHCPKCLVLENKLKQKNIEFTEINDIEVMKEKGYMSVPVLEVDNKPINFIEANAWLNSL